MKVLIREKISPHIFKTPEGYLICQDSILARTGKQTYRKNELFMDTDDDSEIEVDRPYDEVFSKETLASFENKPVTIEHPDEDVTIDNYKDYSVGFARDIRQGKGENGEDVIIGNLIITDKEAIQKIESGEMKELSCGYDCDITDDDNPKQTKIRGNHIALCEQGRAGIAKIIDSAKAKDVKGYVVLDPTTQDMIFVANRNQAIKKAKELSSKNGHIEIQIQSYDDNSDNGYASESKIEYITDSVKDGAYVVSGEYVDRDNHYEQFEKGFSTYQKALDYYTDIRDNKGCKYYSLSMDKDGKNLANDYYGDPRTATKDSVKDAIEYDDYDIYNRILTDIYADKFKATKKNISVYLQYYERLLNHKYSGDIIKDLQRKNGIILYDAKDSVKDDNDHIEYDYRNGEVKAIIENKKITATGISEAQYKKIEKLFEVYGTTYQDVLDLIKKYSRNVFTDSIKDSKPIEYKGYVIVEMYGKIAVMEKGRYAIEYSAKSVEDAKAHIDKVVGSSTKDSVKDPNTQSALKVLQENGFDGFTNRNSGDKYGTIHLDNQFKNRTDEAISILNKKGYKATKGEESTIINVMDSIKDYNEDDDYFGAEEYKMYGEKVYQALKGKTISKRRDLAEEPNGIIYEANKLGLKWNELLRCLEGMCYNGKAVELYPGDSYKIKDSIKDGHYITGSRQDVLERYCEWEGLHNYADSILREYDEGGESAVRRYLKAQEVDSWTEEILEILRTNKAWISDSVKDVDEYLSVQQAKSLKEYGNKYEYSWDDILKGIKHRVNKLKMSMEEAIEDIKDDMVSGKTSLLDSVKNSKKLYKVNGKYVSAIHPIDAIKQFKKVKDYDASEDIWLDPDQWKRVYAIAKKTGKSFDTLVDEIYNKANYQRSKLEQVISSYEGKKDSIRDEYIDINSAIKNTDRYKKEFIELYAKKLQNSPYKYDNAQAYEEAKFRSEYGCELLGSRYHSIEEWVKDELKNTLTKEELEGNYKSKTNANGKWHL